MLRPVLFFVFLILSIGGVIASIERMLADDPFLAVQDGMLVNNDGLSGPILGQIKRYHGLNNTPYDIGVFGSSTSMMITANDLDLPQCRFFNFSILGESLRSSVILIETLADRQKLPPVILVGLDNFEVQNYGNSRIISAFERVREIFRDAMAAIREPEIRIVDGARMMLRHLLTQRDMIERTLNLDLVMATTKHTFGLSEDHALLTKVGSGFRADGSFDWKRKIPEEPLPIMRSGRKAILPGYLRYDLSRIRAATKGKTNVILFETPLEPGSQSYYTKNPTAIASKSRSDFVRACAEFALTCHVAPERLSDVPLIWKDHVHSPPDQLGAYIRRSVPNLEQACQRDL